MKIRQIFLPVPDVPQTTRFFKEFFNLRCIEVKGRDLMAVLYDETGFSVILSTFDRTSRSSYPRNFQMGFMQDNRKQLDALYERLRAAGYVTKAPHAMRGNWVFCFCAPGEIHVEVSCPLGF